MENDSQGGHKGYERTLRKVNGKIGRGGGLEYMVTSNPDDNLEEAVNDEEEAQMVFETVLYWTRDESKKFPIRT